MKKAIQIAAVPETERTYGYLFALYDDGSIYSKCAGADCKNWVQEKGPDTEDFKSEGPVQMGGVSFDCAFYISPQQITDIQNMYGREIAEKVIKLTFPLTVTLIIEGDEVRIKK